MTQQFRVAFIGAGRPLGADGATGYGMAYGHANGYKKTGRCELVAVADLIEGNGEAFAKTNGVAHVYQDYHKMLAEQKPDIVSICTWPHLHSAMCIDAAKTGVKAIHCEKPMATTWADAKAMARTCQDRQVQLTFNHQRRYLEAFQTSRKLIREGSIGTLKRMEATCGDLVDWGTHWIDMLFFYNEETPVEWVIGQIDTRTPHVIFGLKMESQAVSRFKFQNDVRATLYTGQDENIGCAIRLFGSTGEIEICWDKPWVRIRNSEAPEMREVPISEDIHNGVGLDRAMADLVGCLATGAEPETSARKALQTSEVIFATYESSRRRARIDLPLQAEDNAFLSMLESGDLPDVSQI